MPVINPGAITGTNQSWGTIVQGSTLVQNTFTVSGQTNLAAMIANSSSQIFGALTLGSATGNAGSIYLPNASGAIYFANNSGTNYNALIYRQSGGTLVVYPGGSNMTLQLGGNATAIVLSNSNASSGNMRFFAWSGGRQWLTVNATNVSGSVFDVSSLASWAQYYEILSSPQVVWQLVPSSGVIQTKLTLYSSGLAVLGNVSSGTLVITSTVQFGMASAGGGTVTFAAINCPASTLTAPYTWIQATAPDGSIVWIPAWK